MVLKGCSRCHGDMLWEEEVGYVDLVCLQCGARQSVSAGEEGEERRQLVRWLQSQVPGVV